MVIPDNEINCFPARNFFNQRFRVTGNLGYILRNGCITTFSTNSICTVAWVCSASKSLIDYHAVNEVRCILFGTE